MASVITPRPATVLASGYTIRMIRPSRSIVARYPYDDDAPDADCVLALGSRGF